MYSIQFLVVTFSFISQIACNQQGVLFVNQNFIVIGETGKSKQVGYKECCIHHKEKEFSVEKANMVSHMTTHFVYVCNLLVFF